MHLSAIYLYPIKSTRALSVPQAELDAFGLRHDRRWMLVGPDGRFLTQRTHPRLALLECALRDGGGLRVSAPGLEPVALGEPEGDAPEREVTVWSDAVRARGYPDAVDAWFSRALGTACHLVHMPPDVVRRTHGGARRVAFSDEAPLHLLSTASLDGLNRRLPEPVGVERFRPNLLIEGAAEPHAEDHWQRLRVGEVELVLQERCVRCAVTTVDPERGQKAGKEPLRTLAAYRMGEDGVEFGRHAAHAAPGTLRVGDPVQPLPGS